MTSCICDDEQLPKSYVLNIFLVFARYDFPAICQPIIRPCRRVCIIDKNGKITATNTKNGSHMHIFYVRSHYDFHLQDIAITDLIDSFKKCINRLPIRILSLSHTLRVVTLRKCQIKRSFKNRFVVTQNTAVLFPAFPLVHTREKMLPCLRF